MAHRKPLTFEITEEGCRVCTSHTLNKDGYVRLFVSNSVSPRMQFLHRIVWEEVHGKIPEGYEINHKCKNRACSNLDHLECIPGKDHAIETNETRYADIKDIGYQMWLNGTKAKDIAQALNRTPSAVCRWVRKWRSL